MRKLLLLASLISILVVSVLCSQRTAAISQSVVISQVKAGNSTSSRLIELYNNSSFAVDVTNWCLSYSPPSDSSRTTAGCFADAGAAVHVFLAGHSYALLASSQTGVSADLVLSAGLGTGGGGHVYLLDADGIEVDRVGWQSGTIITKNPEGSAAIVTDTKIIERHQVSGALDVFVDTDDNGVDFFASTVRASYNYGSIFEVTDVCNNIDGIQEFVPDNYVAGDNGSCMPPPVDVCINIEGLQTVIPNGYGLDEDGLCQADICVNLDGTQVTIPAGYVVDDQGLCLTNLQTIVINELLPNAIGSDVGNEFIELYNPSSVDVDLSSYQLRIGIDTFKLYSFPTGSIMPANSYVSFSNDDIGYTLINTSSQVSIVSIDSQLINQSPIYSNPGDGVAWALIDNVWQYTNQPTPGSQNLASTVEQGSNALEVTTGLLPCASNQYRNPDTNRCRLLVTMASTITPCKDGQYRSEITNRCRSIAGDGAIQTACDANQERNPETNRCRLITAAAITAAPCKPNQERNPDTNRCRNITGSVPTAAFAVEPIADAAGNVIGWWAIGGVGFVALAYAVWEWREDLLKVIYRFGAFFHSHK